MTETLTLSKIECTILVLPAGPGVTNLQREIARDQHKEDMRVYREVVDLEQALLKQLNAALPELYTKSFRNAHTNSIILPISDVESYANLWTSQQ